MSGLAAYGVLAYGEAPAYVAPTAPTAGQRLLLLSPRDSDAATLSASSETAGATAANLQEAQPRKKWRSTTAAAQYIDVDFGVPVAANALAIVGHNLTQAGMLRVRLASTQADVTASPAVDTGWTSAWPAANKPAAPLWPHHIALLTWSNNSGFRYARVDIADGGTVLSYIEAGRLVLGAAWQPSLNFDLGGTPIGFEVSDVQSKSTYGGLFPDRRTTSPPRVFELTSYAWDRREAFDGLSEIQRLRGGWGDVICCLDPGETTDFHRYTMQGAFTLGGAYTAPPAFNSNGQMFGAAIRLREFI